MNIQIAKNPQELGNKAAEYTAAIINDRIARNGKARIVLSTGASQFETLEALIKQNIDWSKVEMFHLDEYVALPETHQASFRKYLKERFANKVSPEMKAFYVNGEGDIQANIAKLTEEIRKAPIDVGLIGIGENGHIAFNDPPADFDTKESYIVVDLDEACKNQQVGEGWFGSIDEVPKQAISMTVHQIMQCEVIVSCVPHAVKARAVKNFITHDVSNLVPATKLKEHADFILFLDEASASELDSSKQQA